MLHPGQAFAGFALGEGVAAGLVFNSQDAPRGPGCGCHEDEAPVTFSEGGGQAV